MSSDTTIGLAVSMIAALLSAGAIAHLAFYPYIGRRARAHWAGVAMIAPVAGAAVWFAFAIVRNAQVRSLIDDVTRPPR